MYICKVIRPKASCCCAAGRVTPAEAPLQLPAAPRRHPQPSTQAARLLLSPTTHSPQHALPALQAARRPQQAQHAVMRRSASHPINLVMKI